MGATSLAKHIKSMWEKAKPRNVCVCDSNEEQWASLSFQHSAWSQDLARTGIQNSEQTSAVYVSSQQSHGSLIQMHFHLESEFEHL